jgi:hypothetical protein
MRAAESGGAGLDDCVRAGSMPGVARDSGPIGVSVRWLPNRLVIPFAVEHVAGSDLDEKEMKLSAVVST